MTGAPALLDTSVVVRYLTDDPPDLGAAAARVIDSDRPLLLCDLVLVETAHVLTTFYGVPRPATVDALVALVQRRNVALTDLDKPLAVEALLLCRPSRRTSFADAFLWARAIGTGARRVITFDRSFPKRNVDLLEPS